MIPNLEQEAALITAVRQAARTEILPRFRNLSADAIHTKKSPDDLVTEADRRAEIQITAAVRDILPGAVVIGEEAVSVQPESLPGLSAAETSVIIDPIDGTWNFAKGLATFGVILAVTHHGETVLGVLYDPVMDDWVVARRGGGTWFCDAKGRKDRLRLDGPLPDTNVKGVASPWSIPAISTGCSPSGIWISLCPEI